MYRRSQIQCVSGVGEKEDQALEDDMNDYDLMGTLEWCQFEWSKLTYVDQGSDSVGHPMP